MQFKVLKSGFDGICGGTSRYETIDEVLKEISYHAGWDSLKQLHASIRKWSKKASPGSVYCTRASAIVALPADHSCREDDICHHCDHEGLDYGDLNPVEGGDIEQKVTCPECGRRRKDVFSLTDQREMVSLTEKAR